MELSPVKELPVVGGAVVVLNISAVVEIAGVVVDGRVDGATDETSVVTCNMVVPCIAVVGNKVEGKVPVVACVILVISVVVLS